MVLDGAHAVPRGEVDEVFLPRFAQFDFGPLADAAGNGRLLGGHEDDLFVFQQAVFQVVLLRRGGDEGHVAAALAEQFLESDGGQLLQLDGDERIAGEKSGQDLRQQGNTALRRNADAQRGAVIVFHFGDLAEEIPLGRHDLAHAFDIALAGVSQRQPFGAAVEDRQPQFVFHGFDGLRQRGLGDEEFFCGRGDASLLQNRHDIRSVFQIQSCRLLKMYTV